MKKLIFPFLAGIVLCLVGCKTNSSKTSQSESAPKNSVSQELVQQTPEEQKFPVDLVAGEAIYQKGTKSGVAACASCHGNFAEGQPSAGFPRLAGQSRIYMVQQLHSYKSGLRKNSMMTPVAQALTDQEMENVSAFIEKEINSHFPKGPSMPVAAVKRAETLAQVGDSKLDLQSCNNCHGPGGRGEPPQIPSLFGQSSIYIQNQLKAWRTGERKTSPERMGYVAHLLKDSDIKILGDYFQSLPSRGTLRE